MKIAFCDCFSGISGDMFLAAMIDAGLPITLLKDELGKIEFEETFQIGSRLVLKGAIRAMLLELEIRESYHHRTYADIHKLIGQSALSNQIKEKALAIFKVLAEAEAKVHGTTVEDVHFHEVGAMDSIIDIVGAAVGLTYFGIEKLFSSALPVGTGQTRSAHGLLPLPAPATLELMRKGKMNITPSPATKELVTPTGAAILTAFATFSQPSMRIENLGIGAGKRELPWPNILRLVLGEIDSEEHHKEMIVLETNVDDMPPQLFAPVQLALFKAGALDVFFTPMMMKKNRPATMVSVIARKKDEEALASILLRDTTTFGVRVSPIWRHEADREMTTVATPYGEVGVKVKIQDGKPIMAMPEYEDCLKRAEENGVAVIDVYQAALAAAQALINRQKPSRA